MNASGVGTSQSCQARGCVESDLCKLWHELFCIFANNVCSHHLQRRGTLGCPRQHERDGVGKPVLGGEAAGIRICSLDKLTWAQEYPCQPHPAAANATRWP